LILRRSEELALPELEGAERSGKHGEASTATSEASEERSEPRESRERSEGDVVGACSDGTGALGGLPSGLLSLSST